MSLHEQVKQNSTIIASVLLLFANIVMIATYNDVRELAESVPVIQTDIKHVRRSVDDHEARLRDLERQP